MLLFIKFDRELSRLLLCLRSESNEFLIISLCFTVVTTKSDDISILWSQGGIWLDGKHLIIKHKVIFLMLWMLILWKVYIILYKCFVKRKLLLAPEASVHHHCQRKFLFENQFAAVLSIQLKNISDQCNTGQSVHNNVKPITFKWRSYCSFFSTSYFVWFWSEGMSLSWPKSLHKFKVSAKSVWFLVTCYWKITWG